MGLIKSTKSNPHFMKGFKVMKLPISLCFSILDSLFVDNCHKLGNIREHPCALLATNTLHPKYCGL